MPKRKLPKIVRKESMNTNSLTFRFVVILSLLTILNMMFIGVSWHRKEEFAACSVDMVIDGVSKYLLGNGRRLLEQELIAPCKKSGPSRDIVDTLNTAVRNVLTVCDSKRGLKKNITKPAITLFTTWPNSSFTEKEVVHNTTLKNWISLGPSIQVVVFTNDTRVVTLSKTLGFHTLPILHHAGGGGPVLKSMFLTVIKQFESSHLYGYVNSDILFTNSLTESLAHIVNVRSSIPDKPVLIIGRRFNVVNITPSEASTDAALTKTANTRGALFSANAEDFFITNKAFPWNKIIDVVVGRVAYDNFLVGHTICNLHIDVIEVSDTVLAVHQTDQGGNFEGFNHKEAHYNNGLFKQLNIVPVFETGFTLCAQERTYRSLCGEIELTKRDIFWDKCRCPDLSRPKKKVNKTAKG